MCARNCVRVSLCLSGCGAPSVSCSVRLSLFLPTSLCLSLSFLFLARSPYNCNAHVIFSVSVRILFSSSLTVHDAVLFCTRMPSSTLFVSPSMMQLFSAHACNPLCQCLSPSVCLSVFQLSSAAENVISLSLSFPLHNHARKRGFESRGARRKRANADLRSWRERPSARRSAATPSRINRRSASDTTHSVRSAITAQIRIDREWM